jgi:PAS domain S-box-containing protein
MPTKEEEKKRIDDLHSYEIMDTLPEQVFDDITLIASELFDTPMALISLVDGKRQWFKSKVGIDVPETNREIAFCSHAIYQSNTFVVNDASKDSRFRENPLVTGFPNIKFYAGSPLITKEGSAVGTLCVIDRIPRDFSERNQEALNALARQVVSQLEIRKKNLNLKKESDHGNRFKMCLEALNIGFWEWDITNNQLFWDESMYRLYGMDANKFSGAYEAWISTLHEGDKEKATKDIQDALEGTKKFESQFRVRSPNGGVKNISARGEVQFSDDKKPVKMTGLNWDISRDTELDQFVKGLFETSYQPIVTLSVSGDIERVNAAFANLLDCRIEQLAGRNISLYTSSDQSDSHVSQFKNMAENREGSIFVGETKYIKSSGEIVPVLIRSQLIFDIEQRPSYFLNFVTDLTEQKKSEMAMIKSEELFRKLFDFAPVGMVVLDSQSRILNSNKSYQKMLGYSQEELSSMRVSDLTHSEDLLLNQQVREALIGKEVFNSYENRKRTRDGRVIWVNVAYTNLSLPNNSEAIIAVVEDISVAKDAQEKLRETHNQLQIVFDNMKEGLVLQTSSGQIFQSNPAAQEILGLSKDELEGRSSIDPRWQSIKEDGSAFPGVEHPAMVALSTRKIQNSVPMGIRKVDGSLAWLSINAVPLFKPDVLDPFQVVVTFADVTDIKNSQTELAVKNHLISLEKRKFEEFVFALNESAIVTMSDPSGAFTFVNAKFSAISGYSSDEVLGKKIGILNSGVHSIAFFEELWECIKEGKVWTGEICNKSKDGTAFWVASTIVPIFNSSGKIEQYISIQFDTTKRKNLEEYLIESRELERRANSAKSEFLSNMSHEIRTPLNGIIGMADILKRSKLSDEQSGFVGTILHSGNLLLDLINDILDVSKIESGKLELEYIQSNLPDLLQEIIVPHQFKCSSKGVEFKAEIPQSDFDSMIDQSKVAQVINNLLSNAVKFTEKGRVLFSVSMALKSEAQSLFTFRVEDTGIGISNENQHKLFTSFTQAENSISRKYGGTGLGLSIVKKLVEFMGGSISLESTEGVGTAITINLLVKNVDRKNSAGVRDSIEASFNSLDAQLSGRILVAEDNVINQNIITRMVLDLGCVPVLANNGLEALERLKEQTFDLIIMDCRMPEMDGYEASRAIRSGAVQSSITIVALTANASSDDRKLCIEAGMNDFLTKPITREKLFLTLKRFLTSSKVEPSPKYESDSELVDHAIINELRSLNTLKDPNFFDEQRQIFITYSKEIFEKLDKAVEDDDRFQLSELAHSLKGSTASFGAIGISKLCKKLEERSNSLSTFELNAIKEEIYRELEGFYKFLTDSNFDKAS